LIGTIVALGIPSELPLMTLLLFVRHQSLLGVDIGYGRRRVIERPRVGDRCFTSLSLELM
jgi:hypothetical protein